MIDKVSALNAPISWRPGIGDPTFGAWDQCRSLFSCSVYLESGGLSHMWPEIATAIVAVVVLVSAVELRILSAVAVRIIAFKDENAKLKKRVADLSLDKEMLQVDLSLQISSLRPG
jgi:hypothetical protein